MAGRCVSWLLRIGAWAVLLAAATGPLLFPTYAWLRGRIFQMNVRFECHAAEDALLRELGLDATFPPTRYRLHAPIDFDMKGPPLWLTLFDRANEAFYAGGYGGHIFLKADGSCLLPPLYVPPESFDSFPQEPTHIMLVTEDGAARDAAILNNDRADFGAFESTVWIHMGDRWRNVLRIRSQSYLEPGAEFSCGTLFAQTSDPESPFRFEWNAISETFLVAHSTAELWRRPLLPDQTEYRGSPKPVVGPDEFWSYVERNDAAGLVGRYANLSDASLSFYKPPEASINGMGYDALRAGDVPMALAVFKLNVRLFPDSPNVHDSLGEAHEHAGELALAKANYARACELGERYGDGNLALFKRNLARVTRALEDGGP